MTEPQAPKAPSKVPCNGCTLCCYSQAIMLHPEKGDDPSLYQTREVDHPLTGKKVLMIDHKADGSCVHLGAEGCTVYDKRPVICRMYDCRKILLTMPRKILKELVAKGQFTAAEETAARARVHTLTGQERLECIKKRHSVSNGSGHVVIGDGLPTG